MLSSSLSPVSSPSCIPVIVDQFNHLSPFSCPSLRVTEVVRTGKCGRSPLHKFLPAQTGELWLPLGPRLIAATTSRIAYQLLGYMRCPRGSLPWHISAMKLHGCEVNCLRSLPTQMLHAERRDHKSSLDAKALETLHRMYRRGCRVITCQAKSSFAPSVAILSERCRRPSAANERAATGDTA